MLRLIIVTGFLAGSAAAQDGVRETDQILDQAGMTAYLSGHVIEFYSDGIATYGPGGSYAYQYEPGGAPARGRYEIRADGQVCTDFIVGFKRCDIIVEAGERHVMIVENGDRYPIRSRYPIE